jgi:transposase
MSKMTDVKKVVKPVKPTGKRAELVVSPEEFAGLERLSKSRDRAEADRARTILKLVGGADSRQVAAALGLHPAAVRRIKRRFLAQRLAGLPARRHTGRLPHKRAAVLDWVARHESRGRLDRLEGSETGILSASRIAHLVSEQTAFTVSAATVRLALRKGGIATAECGTR